MHRVSPDFWQQGIQLVVLTFASYHLLSDNCIPASVHSFDLQLPQFSLKDPGNSDNAAHSQ